MGVFVWFVIPETKGTFPLPLYTLHVNPANPATSRSRPREDGRALRCHDPGGQQGRRRRARHVGGRKQQIRPQDDGDENGVGVIKVSSACSALVTFLFALLGDVLYMVGAGAKIGFCFVDVFIL